MWPSIQVARDRMIALSRAGDNRCIAPLAGVRCDAIASKWKLVRALEHPDDKP